MITPLYCFQTANIPGEVWTKVLSNSNPNAKDSVLINIIIQHIPVDSVVISSQSGITELSAGSTLQLEADVYPTNASVKSVTWSIIEVSGQASVSESGLITGTNPGKLWIKAISDDNNIAKHSILVSILNNALKLNKITDLEKQIIIYPNPSNGELFIKSESCIKVSELLNLSGQVILKMNYLSDTFNSKLNLCAVQKGVYYINVIFSDYTQLTKPVIIK